MPLLIQLNVHYDKASEFTKKDDNFLITAFNRLPKDITAENICKRRNRPYLISVAEDLNAKNFRSFDILDVLVRLQSLRKLGKLQKRTTQSYRDAARKATRREKRDDDNEDDLGTGDFGNIGEMSREDIVDGPVVPN